MNQALEVASALVHHGLFVLFVSWSSSGEFDCFMRIA